MNIDKNMTDFYSVISSIITSLIGWIYWVFSTHPRIFFVSAIIILLFGWYLYRRLTRSTKKSGSDSIWNNIMDSIKNYTTDDIPIERTSKRKDRIGGMTKQLEEIKRQVKIPRTLDKKIKEKLELRDVRGIILYGPPGTGKTMMARNIADHLGCKSFVKKAAVSLLNKYYGESETKLRNLFKHEPGQLHMVVLDEIETICGTRNGSSVEGKLYSSMTNQLLSLMDGLDHDPDIIVVGTTNRLKDIDEAILRKGRFDLQIEVGLPDDESREEILKVYSEHLINDDLMEPYDISSMVERTKNMSGADIENIFREAKTSAVCRHYETGEKIFITEADLINSLRK